MNPDDIDKAVAALKAQGAPDEAIHAYLQHNLGLQPVEDGHHDFHAEFRSGALQKRMDAANARDMASAQELDAAEHDQPTIAGGLANLAHGIPGVEALQAGVRSLVRGQSYRDAYQDIEHARESLPRGERILTEFAGAAPLAAVPGSAAMTGAAIGGASGLLDANPDADLSDRVLNGAGGALVGGVLGKGAEMVGTAGRALFAPSLAKGQVLRPSTATTLLGRQAERAQSAKGLYDASINSNKGMPFPDAVKAFLQEPDIAPIVDRLTSLRVGLKQDTPELLDAVYKALSDQEKALEKGLAQPDPSKANVGRYLKEHVGNLKQRLLDVATVPGERTVTQGVPKTRTETIELPSPTTAQSPAPSLREAIDAHQRALAEAARRTEGTPLQQNRNPFTAQRVELTPAMRATRDALERHAAENVVSPSLTGQPGMRTTTVDVPYTQLVDAQVPAAPPLPGYRDAVGDFAQRTKEIQAAQKAYDVLRQQTAGALPSARNLTRTSPESFAEFMARTSRTPGEAQAAKEGALGFTRDALRSSPLRQGRRAVAKTPAMLRQLHDVEQLVVDRLIKAGLLAHRADE